MCNSRRRNRIRPRLEALEPRRLLATILVDSISDDLVDDGNVTLREAVIAANANISVDGSEMGDSGRDVIRFAPSLDGSTIELSGDELVISESLEIEGSGAANTIISGNGLSRIFRFVDVQTEQFTLASMTIQNGRQVADNDNQQEGFGGAVNFQSAHNSSLVIRDTWIKDSVADVGGGLFVRDANVQFERSTISNNTANFGGGVALQRVQATMTNVTVESNQAAVVAGGISHSADGIDGASHLDLIHVTLVENESINTGNIRTSSDDGVAVTQIRNSIVGGGIAPNDVVSETFTASGTASTISLGHNLFDPLAPSSVLIDSDARILFEQLGALPLEFNGGGVPTRALHPLSFAIDFGNNELAVGPGPDLQLGTSDDQPLTSDSRGQGFARVIAGGSGLTSADAGAFEVQQTLVASSNFVVSNPSDELFRRPDVDLDDLTLREAIGLANLQRNPNSLAFHQDLHGTTITLSSGLSLRVRDDLVITGPGADELTIDANGQNRHFLFSSSTDDGVTFEIRGLTLENGMGTASGGAIFAQRNRLVVRDSVFRGNTSSFLGGAIFLSRAESEVLSSSFIDNETSGSGGAVAIHNTVSRLSNLSFENNRADGSGGAVNVRVRDGGERSDVQVSNSTYANNQAGTGADIAVTTWSEFGRIETIADEQWVVSVDQDIVFRSDTLPEGAIDVIGTNAIDTIVISDFRSTGRLIPIQIDGLGENDQLIISSMSEDGINHITTANVEQINFDPLFEFGATLTPALASAAAGANQLVLDVDNSAGVVSETGWSNAGTTEIDGRFGRVVQTNEIQMVLLGGDQWTNPLNATDVNASGASQVLDALLIINELSRRRFTTGDPMQLVNADLVAVFPDLFFDTSSDGRLSALDALVVINQLAREFNALALPQPAPLFVGVGLDDEETDHRVLEFERLITTIA